MTSTPIRILIRHEDPLICAGLHAAFAMHPEFALTPPRADQADAASAIAPDVLVTDHAQAMQVLGMRGAPAQAAAQYGAGARQTRILVVTSLAGEHQIRQAVMAGVNGYVVQGGTLAEYVDAVRALGKGLRFVCRRASQELMDSVAQASLTTREREVLCPLVRGLANKAIARELGISVGTVKVHVRSILDKLHASSRTQAASVAAQRGLVESGASHAAAQRPVARPAGAGFDTARAHPRSSAAIGLSARAA